ncbi:class I histocompatibility antigen, F10 alpha chain-like isoform X2 [Hemicordylus capensis]|uniref:class I histocompatibility antigen, F10 alpha chain-like isoform X2 n=1 Tax=Hemicordylus capensis TaxID=884348 RepID=UPI0023030C41|nr:class I histocompatibility antigen, F10 alpha chain-like isoform X2 [Hemicordylus capensis]
MCWGRRVLLILETTVLLVGFCFGFHTWQNMYGCILIEHGHKTGFFQYGYDGRDLIHSDKETLTWVAANEEAQVTTRKWNTELANNQYKAFLEKTCIESLRKFLEYGTEALLRKVPPAVKVIHKAGYDGMETLVCQAHGFYPKEIEIDWMKDGEVWKQSTFHGQGPNPDGTYHTWLGIEIDPKDRDRYHCRVEHDSLGTPVDVAWEESVPVWIFVGCVVGALAVTFMFVTGITFYIRKWRGDGYRAAARRGRRAGYREAATSDQKSDSSTEA